MARETRGAAPWGLADYNNEEVVLPMQLRPLGDRVLVKPDKAEQKTSAGLYISSGAQEKPQRGTVIAVGAGKLDDKGERIPIDVKVGDAVIYGKYGGNEVKVDGEDYLLHARLRHLRHRRGVGAGWRCAARSHVTGISASSSGGMNTMAKQIAFNAEARAKLAKGVNTLADAVTATIGPKGRYVALRALLRRSHHHQRRRVRRQGDRAPGQRSRTWAPSW